MDTVVMSTTTTIATPIGKQNPGGIYRIRNKITGDSYVGSTINFNNRWNDHFKRLRLGTHVCTELQANYNKFTRPIGTNPAPYTPQAAFCAEILVRLPTSEFTFLAAHEQFWIVLLKPNLNTDDIVHRRANPTQTAETKRKIGEGRARANQRNKSMKQGK